MSREYVLQPFRPPINLQIDYAGELNPQQHAAVTAPPGPSLVLAGAGGGQDAHADLPGCLPVGAGNSSAAHITPDIY
jgi:hypothetical protein